ncbi:MAG: glycosyltransferase family 2 protein [bacterium]|nr:glycosyltransferase family 2 protein [bacterium]
MKPFIDVVVVLWKSAPYMEALFEGLETVRYPHESLRVHFVNNDPEEGSMDAVRAEMRTRVGQLPPIQIHEPGKNTGFSGGNNLVMRIAIEAGHPYVYLLNHDASFEPFALLEAVEVAEARPNAGSVQSLLVLQQDPEILNSWGNEIHLFGFGYCGGWKEPRSSAPTEVKHIAYATGAGVLYQVEALKKVGLLDEDLFLYHEDLDLGWRLLLAGYDNLLAPKSVVQHRYEFSRSITKMYWMERNRLLVMFKNYHVGTLILLAPFLFVLELGLLILSIRGKWWREKIRSYNDVLSRSSFSYIRHGRKEIKKIRSRRDQDIIPRFTTRISYQDVPESLMNRIAHPVWNGIHLVMKKIVIW